MQRTTLETTLLVFLTFQMLVSIFVLTSSSAEFTLFGDNFEAYGIFISLLFLNCYLIFKLVKPSVAALILGAILYGIYIFEVTWSTGLFAFSLGIQINFFLFEIDGINVSLNLGNLISLVLFVIALKERLSVAKTEEGKPA